MVRLFLIIKKFRNNSSLCVPRISNSSSAILLVDVQTIDISIGDFNLFIQNLSNVIIKWNTSF